MLAEVPARRPGALELETPPATRELGTKIGAPIKLFRASARFGNVRRLQVLDGGDDGLQPACNGSCASGLTVTLLDLRPGSILRRLYCFLHCLIDRSSSAFGALLEVNPSVCTAEDGLAPLIVAANAWSKHTECLAEGERRLIETGKPKATTDGRELVRVMHGCWPTQP